MKRQTYDFSQLERPSTYWELDKYWSIDKNIFDYRILDFSSKLNNNIIIFIFII
jgi:hypothetical protein